MIDLIMQCTQCELAYTGVQKRIVEGCREYVRVIFQMCPDWLALDVVMAAFYTGDAKPVGVQVVDGVCMVPAGIIAAPSFSVALVGVDADGTRVVSTPVTFNVVKSRAVEVPVPGFSSLEVASDGQGHVTISGVSATSDGAGHVTLALSPGTTVESDGQGHVFIV